LSLEGSAGSLPDDMSFASGRIEMSQEAGNGLGGDSIQHFWTITGSESFYFLKVKSEDEGDVRGFGFEEDGFECGFYLVFIGGDQESGWKENTVYMGFFGMVEDLEG
jgi:hypothetical protein